MKISKEIHNRRREFGHQVTHFFRVSPSKLHSMCPEKHFGGKEFWRVINLSTFFGVWAKNFRQGCRNCIVGVQRNSFVYKREHVHSESANSGEKNPLFEGMIFLSYFIRRKLITPRRSFNRKRNTIIAKFTHEIAALQSFLIFFFSFSRAFWFALSDTFRLSCTRLSNLSNNTLTSAMQHSFQC